MSKVFIEEATLTGIADAIREKEGAEGLIPTTEMPDRIMAIETGCVNYLNYVQNCTFASLNLFGASKVELTLPKAIHFNSMFKPTYSVSDDIIVNANTTVEELIIHCPNPIRGIQQMFSLHNAAKDYTLKKITFDVDFSQITHISYAFKSLCALEVINGNPIYLGALTGDTAEFLLDCPKLKTIRFTGLLQYNLGIGRTCTELSKESLVSLISCLSDTVTGKTITLPLGAVDTAFETSEGAADGSTSEEWLALVEAHTNWTISLI